MGDFMTQEEMKKALDSLEALKNPGLTIPTMPKKRSKKARIEDLEQRIAQLEKELRELRCQVLYHNTWPPIQPYYPPIPLQPSTPYFDPGPPTPFAPYQYPNTSGSITFPSETK